VRPVLCAQRRDGLGRQAREASDVSAHLITQCPHRIGSLPGGIQPALDRRDGEADIESGERMSPRLGGQRVQGIVQFACRRWGGQQRSDDREAQPRPSISRR